MQDNFDVQEAVRLSLQTEKNAMNFYLMAARNMTGKEARRLFEILAGEERDHARQFFRLYRRDDIPNFDSFMDSISETEKKWLSVREGEVLNELGVRKAMELAMLKEQKLEEQLLRLAAKIDNPEVRAIFEENATSTNHHYQLIESEYAHLMGMVHETDIDTYVRE